MVKTSLMFVCFCQGGLCNVHCTYQYVQVGTGKKSAYCTSELCAILSTEQFWALYNFELCLILSSVCYRKPVVSKTHFTCSIPNLIFLVFLGVPHQRFDPTGCDQRFPRSERGSRATVAPPVDADWNHSGLGGGHQRTQQKHHHFLRGQRLTRQVKMSILV